MAYAEGTTVSVERSRAEIERMLLKAGAKERGIITGEAEAHVFFLLHRRRVLFKVPMPGPSWEPRFWKTATGSQRRAGLGPYREGEERRRWRALGLVLKAKLESVASGIEVFEDAFLAQIVMPSGRTVAEEVRAPIEAAYASGKVQPLLPQWTGSGPEKGQ